MLDDGVGRAVDVRRADTEVIEMTMGEGRKRVVRRMCAAVGLEVLDLVRVAVGSVTLGTLAEGESRALSNDELRALRDAVGMGDA